jgi:hypothetical protein
LTNENIGGVPLGLRIARDIFAFGAGKAPKMTPPGTANPPITTPPPDSPMPALPKQPASVGGCAGAALSGSLEGETAEEETEKVQGEFPGASKKDESGTKESDAFKP